MVISAGYTLRGHWWARLRKPPITEERNAICCTCCHVCTPKPPQHESGIQYRRCCYCRRAVAPEGHNGSVVHGARVVGGECMYIGQTPPPTHVLFMEDAVNKNRRCMLPGLSTFDPASSPVHPPGRTRGARTWLPIHHRGHSRDLEPTPAPTRVRRASMGSDGGGGAASGDGPDS